MATFAEYPVHNMAPNDFTLYPDPESWTQEQSYLSTSTYPDRSFMNATAFEPYQTYAASASYTQFDFEQAPAQAKDQYCSPAHSIAHSFEYPNPPHFSATSDSGNSTISSAMGSPAAQAQSNEWNPTLNLFPDLAQQHGEPVYTTSYDYDTIPVTDKGCVDPSLIQPFSPSQVVAQFTGAGLAVHSPRTLAFPAASPVPSRMSSHSDRAGSAKPCSPLHAWQPYPQQQHNSARRPSISSMHSRHSQGSHSSDESNKGMCPIATCGRHVKDLKAHMLTHQQERPEKCPIPTCEYHIKGFARKYDKNRHTLTHYKGTMVCGFCPGSGSAAEKSFNRADVFKRHLTSVHGVEQTPPNARRKSPPSSNKKSSASTREVSGMCSTCGNTFANAQDFYEHLDDCVLRVVQQAEPSEANNEKLLTEISQDKDCQSTLEKHNLPIEVDLTVSTNYDHDDELDDDCDEDDANDGTYGKRGGRIGKRVGKNGAIVKSGPRKGLTLSKNGVALAGAMTAKGSKRRRNYPLSWGAAPDQMKMKKRVLCVYDGQRRLWKDDMMLDAEHEVRIPLNTDDPRGPYVTDLDVLTLRRAEGLHNATEEEKGPWMEDEEALERLMMDS